MDLSALIFVALAVAWAAYLIPKALKQHEEDRRGRTVEAFSTSMRVLARRESADGRTARLVVPGRPAADAVEVEVAVETVTPSAPTSVPAPRRASPAQRRRRVLGLLLLANLTLVVLAGSAVVAWAWTAVPGTLLVGWLVACRLMVKAERRRPRVRRTVTATVPLPGEHVDDRIPVVPDTQPESTGTDLPSVDDEPATEEIETVGPVAESAPGGWDPVPVTLPTYVSKEPAARRTVRTIDLDSTGVWTSGRSESDSALAREADEAARAEKQADADAAEIERRRASGS